MFFLFVFFFVQCIFIYISCENIWKLMRIGDEWATQWKSSTHIEQNMQIACKSRS